MKYILIIVQSLTVVYVEYVEYLAPMRQQVNSEIDDCYLPTIDWLLRNHHWVIATFPP